MLENLNENQLKAVKNTEGPMLVLAGAGSGKTRVLTTRIAYLIKEKNVDYRNILAITFTNKAAQEMKDRVEGLLGIDTRSMWIGTFHSIGVRILRRGAEDLGYTSNFTIYDRADQKTLLKEVYKDLDLKSDHLPYNSALAAISGAKNKGLGPEDFGEFSAGTLREEAIERVYRLYEKKKLDYNAMDFDDLIMKSIEVLKTDEEARKYYQDRFEYIFVDEYQDTNTAQYEMVKILSEKHKNLCVVGDQDQSIYGWRGADIRNIIDFEKDFKDASLVILEENYRSRPSILNAANELIKNNSERKDKVLFSSREDGEKPAYKNFMSENEEARALAEKMKDLRSEGIAYSNMAVLYRTNGQSRVIEEEMVNYGIPYKVVGGLKFYDRKEIKDILAYLNLLVNPRDEISFTRVINEPKRGIGDKTLGTIQWEAEARGMSSLAYVMEDEPGLSARAKKGLEEFKDIIKKSKVILEEKDLFFAIKDIIGYTGLASALELEDTVEARSRLENIDSFLSSIASFVETNPDADLETYLASVSLMSDVDKTEEAAGVSLMTIHGAKGLEFPVVFVTGLEEGLFPSKFSIDEGNVEEERRLFYVAITRAEDRLYLSSASSRRVFGKMMSTRESRFIEELKDTIDYKEEEHSSYMTKTNTNPRDKSQNWDLNYLNYGLEERKKSLDDKKDSYKLGDKVEHKKFGVGTIINIEDKEILISFEGLGLKKLRSDIAPLKKL